MPDAYQGQEKDPETGKEAFQLRLWDARIGRWLTTDPKGQYSSPYLGMGNNPISRIDPDGGFDGPGDDLSDGAIVYGGDIPGLGKGSLNFLLDGNRDMHYEGVNNYLPEVTLTSYYNKIKLNNWLNNDEIDQQLRKDIRLVLATDFSGESALKQRGNHNYRFNREDARSAVKIFLTSGDNVLKQITRKILKGTLTTRGEPSSPVPLSASNYIDFLGEKSARMHTFSLFFGMLGDVSAGPVKANSRGGNFDVKTTGDIINNTIIMKTGPHKGFEFTKMN